MGFLEIIQRSYDRDRAWPDDTMLYIVAGAPRMTDKLQCVRYAHENGCPWHVNTTSYIATHGNFALLRYAHEHGCPWAPRTSENIVLFQRDVAVIEYAHQHGCPWHEETTCGAAMGGCPQCLRYAHEHGATWSDGTTKYAALNGHLSCLQYAHENGAAWDEDTTCGAATNGNLECLQYAHEHGCPWHEDTIPHLSPSEFRYPNSRVDCVRYALRHDCPISGTTALSLADAFWISFTVSASALDVVRLVHRRRPDCVSRGIKRQLARHVFLPMWRRHVRARAIFFYWLERAARTSCAPGGPGRKRDREAFEADVA